MPLGPGTAGRPAVAGLAPEFRFWQKPGPRQPPTWTCPLERRRCLGQTPTGGCGRSVQIGLPYCPAHLHAVWQVRILPSHQPGGGLGLFAWRYPAPSTARCNDKPVVFPRGHLIMPYGGQLRTREETQALYGDTARPYIGHVAEGDRLFDGACRRSAGSMANTCMSKRPPYRSVWGCSNAELKPRGPVREKQLFLVATKPIHHGKRWW